jgi:hypothetical protein
LTVAFIAALVGVLVATAVVLVVWQSLVAGRARRPQRRP